MNRFTLIASFLLQFFVSAVAQTDTEFWFVAPEIAKNGSSNFDIPVYFRITSYNQPAQVTISQPANASFAPIIQNIPANSFISIDLSLWLGTVENTPANSILNYGFHIVSNELISVYYDVAGGAGFLNPDIFALKGKNALGTNFFVPGQNSFSNSPNYTPGPRNSFHIVATEDNTQVSITPQKDIVGHSAGNLFTITLNKGQTYNAQAISSSSSQHLSGSVVNANKPIAITMSDDLLHYNSCDDLIGDQLIPVNITGNEYIVVKGELSGTAEQAFVVATENNTEIYTDGNPGPVATLNAGETYPCIVSGPSVYITSSKPVYVFQISGIGCELGGALIPPIGCTGSQKVAFARSNSEPLKLIITTKTGHENNFTVNGLSGIVTGSDFSVVTGTNGQWVAAKVTLPVSQFPSGSVVVVENSGGLFHLGVFLGNVTGGCSFGYFSDFSGLDLGESIVACKNETTLLDAGQGYQTYLWNTGATTAQISVNQNGIYAVTVTDGACILTDSIQVMISNLDAGSDQVLMCVDSIQLNASGAMFYSWSPQTGLSNPFVSNPKASPSTTTVFTVSGGEISGSNLITNGDFESGNQGFTSQHIYNPNTYYEGYYFVTNNPQSWHPLYQSCNDNSTGSGLMMVVNGAIVANLELWGQSIQVQPNTTYAFSAWICNAISSPILPCQLQFYINGTLLGNIFSSPPYQCQWQQFYILWNSGSSTTANIKIMNQNTTAGGNDFCLDDISLAAIRTCSDEVTVSVENPVTGFLGNDTLLCKNESLTLSVPAGTQQVLWSTGQTSNSITIQESGLYWVQGMASGGCPISDSFRVDLLQTHIGYGQPDNLKRLYYLKGTASPYNLYSARLDGSDETLLVSGVVDASMGGNKIAYHDGANIYTVNLDGSNPTLVPNTNDNPYQVEISKDGSKISYTGTANTYKLFTIHTDGSNKILFNDGSISNQHQTRPSWKENGIIYFVISNYGNAYTQKIYSKPENSAAMPPTQLTTGFGQNPISGGPGNKVSFNGTNGVLYLMNPDGSNISQLTNAGPVAWGGFWEYDTLYYTSNGNIGRITSNNTGNSILINDGNIVKVIGKALPVDQASQDTTICKGGSVTLTALGEAHQGICSKSQLPANLQQGLVAFYPFCGNAHDESGNGNDGTVHGATLTSDRFGNANNAYSFNGLNNYIEAPSSSDLNFGDTINYTYNIWVKFNSNQSSGLVGKSTPGLAVGSQIMLTSSKAKFDFMTSQPTQIIFIGNSVLNNDVWHLISVIAERSLNKISIFIDGNLDAFHIDPNLSLANINNTATLKIGVERVFSDYYNGLLDDVMIYDRALSATEIQQLYSIGSSTSFLWSTGDTTSTITVTPTQTTTYTLTQSIGGISCSDTVTVFVAESGILNTDTTICKGESLTLKGFSNCSNDWDYFEDFEDPTGNEWSDPGRISFNSSMVSGPFGNQTNTLNFNNLPTHDSVEISFDLYIHDTWDGNSTQNGPDIWTLISDQSSLLNATFTNNPGQVQSYPQNLPAANPLKTGAFNGSLPVLCSSWVGTSLYKIERKFSHFPNSLMMQFIGSADQNSCDESWSIDNVHIRLKNSDASSYLWSTGDTTANISVTPQHTTTYYLTVTCNGVSCVDSVRVTVQETAAQLLQDTAFCAGTNTQLTAASGYSGYLWSTGATTQSIQPAQTGWYWVQVPNPGGCSLRDSCHVTIFPLPLDIGDTLKPGSLPLIAWYPLDKDGLDYSGNNHHGTPMNTYWFEPGIVDSCIHLVGQGYMTSAGGHVLLPDLELDTLDGFTISLWVYEIGMSHSDGEAYIMWGDHSNAQIAIGHFGTIANASLQFSAAHGQQINYAAYYQNKWVNYVLSYQNSHYYGYINDTLVASGNETASAWGTQGAIGRHWWYNNSATSSRFIGKIDDVRIYGGSYCPQEIRAIEDTLLLTVHLGTSDVCIGDTAVISIFNPQPYIQYQLFEPVSGQNIGPAIVNSCDSVIRLVTPSLINSITLKIRARDTVHGCERILDTTFTLTVHPNPVISLGNDTVLCSNTGISLSAPGGFTQYQWSNSSTSPATTLTASGSYWCEVRNASGCTARDSIQITLKPIPQVTINPASGSICQGDSMLLTAQSSLPATTWNWNTSAISSAIMANPLISTTYTVTGTLNGCSDTAQVILTVKPKPVAQILPQNPAVCFGDSVLITASSSIPGSGFAWSTGLTTASFWTGSLGTTGYLVTVTYDGCQDSASVFVTVNYIPMISISPDSTGLCEGDSITLTAIPMPPGGTFLWNTGAGGNTLTVSPAGTSAQYSLVYTYSGCSNSDTATLLIHPVPVVSINPMNPAVCTGDTLILNALSSIPGVLWQWNTGQLLASDTVLVLGNSQYSVTATLDGCAGRDSTQVSVQIPPLISITPASPSICAGDSLVLLATSVPASGSFQWSTGSTGPSITIHPVTSASYTVTATAGLCIRDTSIGVQVRPLPLITMYPADTAVCKGDSLLLTAGSDIPGSTFQWTFGDTTSEVLIIPYLSSYYHVIVNANGCADTGSAHISVRNLPEFSLGPDGYFCEGEQLMLTGPSGNFTYQWQDNSGLPEFAVTAPGEYWLVVDDNGCVFTDSIVLKKCSEIWVPNAFTPNGDQVNDVFKPKYEEISDYELYIYSRWGELLFESKDPETGWDGTFKGSDSPSGVYYYLILYKGVGNVYNGVSHKLQGVVTLVR